MNTDKNKVTLISALRSPAISLRVGIVAVLGVLIVGCQSAQVAQPLTAKLSGNEPESQLEFWHTLAERHVTSNDEAFHGLLLYLDNKDSAANYPDRVLALKTRHMLPENFNAPAEQAVTRGNLAVAILHALQIKGGWVLHVFGPSPRYALRELEFEGVYPPSSENQTFSGSEFVGVIGKMEDVQGEKLAAK
jgi:hypothetical protein